MHDRRLVDDLSIEELEQVIAQRKQQARLTRLKYLEQVGRRLPSPILADEAAFIDTFPEDAPPHRRSLRDRLLLLVEVGAVLVLVGAFLSILGSLSALNQRTAAARSAQIAALPTATPTPLIRSVVLPSGHRPPAAPGGDALPNYDEVPPYLRAAFEQEYIMPVIIATPEPEAAVRIRIPAIQVDAPILLGDGWEQLKLGVA